MEHYYNRIEDANDKQIPNSFVNPHGSLVAANWTQGIEGGREGQTEPVPCVYGVSSMVLIGKPIYLLTLGEPTFLISRHNF